MERDRLPGCKSCERIDDISFGGNGILLLVLNSLVPGINFFLFLLYSKKPALLSSRDGYLLELTGWTKGSQAS